MSKIEKLKYFMEKIQFSLHNLKLASHHQKNNSKIVTIIFKIFLRIRT
jgi:hypothetical protein